MHCRHIRPRIFDLLTENYNRSTIWNLNAIWIWLLYTVHVCHNHLNVCVLHLLVREVFRSLEVWQWLYFMYCTLVKVFIMYTTGVWSINTIITVFLPWWLILIMLVRTNLLYMHTMFLCKIICSLNCIYQDLDDKHTPELLAHASTYTVHTNGS